MRMGLIFKGIMYEIKKVIAPESAFVSTKYHHIKDMALSGDLVKQAALVVLAFFFSLRLAQSLVCSSTCP